VSIHDSDHVGAFVLDALSPEETAAFEEHLRTCKTCRQEVAELSKVVAILPLATEHVEPSEGLHDRIVAAVQEQGSTSEAPTSLPVPKRTRGRRTGTRPAASLFALAAAVVIAALGVWNVRLQQKASNNEVATEVLRALIHHPAVAVLPGRGVAQGASATVIQPDTGATAYAVVDGLPPAPSGKVYQLWVMREGGAAPVSAGVFQVTGKDIQYWKMRRPSARFPLAAFTVEPAPHGSKQPTTPAIMSGRFSA